MEKIKRCTQSPYYRNRSHVFREDTTEQLIAWRDDMIRREVSSKLLGKNISTGPMLVWVEDELERRGVCA